MNLSFRFLTTLALMLPLWANAQKMDSLLAVLDTAKNENRVKTLNELYREYSPSDPVKALGYTREALSYATEVGDRKGEAASYNNLGIAYRAQGAFDKALEYYIKSLRIYEELNNTEGIASTKNNIANIYSIKRDYNQAMKYLDESYKLLATLNDAPKIVGSLNNLGNIHNDIQMFEKALEYYNEAYSLGQKSGLKFADPLTNIGNIYFRQKNYQRAVEYYEKALAIEREQNNKQGALNILTNIAVTFTKAKQTKVASAYLEESLNLCNELQAYSFLPAIYKAQAENFANEGNWKEAYNTQVKYDEVRERILGEESTRKIAQMEILLNFNDIEKQYAVLRHQDEIKTLELHRARLVIVMIILGVLVTIGALNYIFLTKKRIIHGKSA